MFLWVFLRKEAMAGGRAKKVELHKIASRFSSELARAYDYLGLDSQTIANGLVNSRQAEHDTALHFNISPKAVRSLLSKSLPF